MKRLACCSILAGVATLFHCGGAGDVTIGPSDGGGGSDGASAEAGESHDGGSDGKDGAGDATSSSGSGADTGAASSSGGDSGDGTETGDEDSGAGEGGGADSGAADTGSGDTGSGDGGSADTGGADTGLVDTGSPDTGAADTGATDSGASDASDGGGGETGTPDGGTHDSGASDAADGGSSATAEFRVAALMPSPAAIDFCWQQGGGAWNGPVMLGWGIAQRLAYQQVTEYVKVPVAATTVRIVASTATDCNTSAGDVLITPPAANAAYLVSSFSNGNVAPQVKAFTDELTTTGASNTNLRAIHAALDTPTGGTAPQALPVDFYLPATAAATVLFDDVAYATTAPAGAGVDANGYLSHDVLTSVDLRVRLHTGATDLLDIAGFSTTGGHVYSLFTTGVHQLVPPSGTPMKLVVCDDTAAPVGHLGVCSVVGTDL
jgi:hypothetical protein